MRYFGSHLFPTFRSRLAVGAPTTVLSALTASTLLCCATAANVGCVERTPDDATQRAASQRATQQEREKQNRNLIDQVVRATEEQENYPDPTYLRGALSRLNGWLANLPAFADFEPDAEFARLADETAALAETARQSAKLVALFADEKGTPTEKDANELQAVVEKAATETAALAESLDSDALRRFAAFSVELRGKLASAKEFQFADATETFQTQIRQFLHSPFYNFETLAAGLDEFSRLLRLDARSFAPQDADFLKETVWLRDVYGWAKGKDQNDLAVVRSLFDWTVANVVLTPPLETPAGPIAQRPWQTLLVGQGTPLDRALVFIELLRQHRLDAFVVRPDDANGAVPPDFPLVVGARLDGEVYLFLPEYGLPIPAAGADALVLDGGLRFDRIATLSQVAADDSILRRLDLPERPFPATAAQFARTVALVPSTPFLTAERSLAIEREFGGTVSTVLATPFESQKARLAELAGVVRVERLQRANAAILEQIFFPFESETLTRPYAYALATIGNLEVSDGKSDRADALIADDQKLDASTLADAGADSSADGAKKATIAAPLWKGKILYFKGRFVDEAGAAHWFQQGRVSDRALRQEDRRIQEKTEAAVAEYVEWARAQGVEPSREELQAFALQTATAFQTELGMKHYIKAASKFYLALLSDAAGHTDAALSHLRDAALGREDGVWRSGSLYLLARILERRGETASAVNLLRSTPTDAGRLLRARWLADLAGLASPNENAPNKNAPSESR